MYRILFVLRVLTHLFLSPLKGTSSYHSDSTPLPRVHTKEMPECPCTQQKRREERDSLVIFITVYKGLLRSFKRDDVFTGNLFY